MSKFSSSLLETIEKEHITPRPKWQFVLMHIVMWTLLVISVIIGSFAMSIVFHDLFDMEWDLIGMAAGGRARGIMLVLPYVWIIFLLIALFIGSVLFRETKHGYRIRPWMIVGSAVLLSVVMGAVLYKTGVAEHIDERLRERVGAYAQMRRTMGDIWRAPERGVLAGRILVVNNQDSFTLSDPMQQEWQVMVVPPPPRIGAPVRPLIAPKLQPLEAGVRVIMRGVRVGEREFNAFEVRPWRRGEF